MRMNVYVDGKRTPEHDFCLTSPLKKVNIWILAGQQKERKRIIKIIKKYWNRDISLSQGDMDLEELLLKIDLKS